MVDSARLSPMARHEAHCAPVESPRQSASPYAVSGASPNAPDEKPDACAFPGSTLQSVARLTWNVLSGTLELLQ